MTTRPIASGTAFSKFEKCRSYLSQVGPLSRSRFPPLSSIHCPCSTSCSGRLHPPSRCLHHALMSPIPLFYSRLYTNTSGDLPTPAWTTPFSFLQAVRPCAMGHILTPRRTVNLILSFSFQTRSKSVRMSASSNYSGIRGIRV